MTRPPRIGERHRYDFIADDIAPPDVEHDDAAKADGPVRNALKLYSASLLASVGVAAVGACVVALGSDFSCTGGKWDFGGPLCALALVMNLLVHAAVGATLGLAVSVPVATIAYGVLIWRRAGDRLDYWRAGIAMMVGLVGSVACVMGWQSVVEPLL